LDDGGRDDHNSRHDNCSNDDEEDLEDAHGARLGNCES